MGGKMTADEFEKLDSRTKATIRAGLSDLGKAACDYCDMGWSVIPLSPRSKVPITGSGIGQPCDDWELACYFWMNYPECNVGIVTGQASGGLVVIDVDQNEYGGKYGAESLFDWEQANGKLPETVCATTGSGGAHYYFRTTSSIKCSANRELCIDRKGDGGYVVAPPSINKEGGRYEWDLGPSDFEVAFVDNKVMELIAYCDGGGGIGQGNGKYQFPEVVHDGEGREQNLVTLAFSLRAHGYEKQDIERVLHEVNDERVVPPKPDKDIRRIARSVCKKPAGLSPEYAASKARAEKRKEMEALQAAEEFEQRQRDAQMLGVFNEQDLEPINPDDFKMGRSGIDHEAVANDIVRRFHFCFVDGVPTVWTGARYETGWKPVSRMSMQYKHAMKEAERKEIRNYMETREEDYKKEQAPWNYIAFNNGVLDVKTMEFARRSPEQVIPNTIPHDWNPGASNDMVNGFLYDISCGDEGVLANLHEIIGMCMCRSCFVAKSFFLVNNSGMNGKSTFMNFLVSILGRENVSSVDPQLMGMRFQTVPMMGTLANIADDIPADFADKTGLAIFKKVVSGDFVPYEVKGGSSGVFKPYCTCVFSMNQVPPLGDSTGGMMRRIHPVPFNADFRGQNVDKFLGEKLAREECCEAAIVLGVHALRRIIEVGDVTQTKFSRSEVEDIELTNNQVKLFLVESGLNRDNLELHSTKKLFEAYREWAEESNIRNAYSHKRFSNEVCALEGMTTRKTTSGGGGNLYRFVLR